MVLASGLVMTIGGTLFVLGLLGVARGLLHRPQDAANGGGSARAADQRPDPVTKLIGALTEVLDSLTGLRGGLAMALGGIMVVTGLSVAPPPVPLAPGATGPAITDDAPLDADGSTRDPNR